MEQIHEEYNGQWIFMINCRQDDSGTVIGGEVVLNSENRENVIRKMSEHSRDNGVFYLRYAGRIPEGVSFLI